MDITKISEAELKAMKADIYESNMQNAQNLQVINTELQRRKQVVINPEDLKTENQNEENLPA